MTCEYIYHHARFGFQKPNDAPSPLYLMRALAIADEHVYVDFCGAARVQPQREAIVALDKYGRALAAFPASAALDDADIERVPRDVLACCRAERSDHRGDRASVGWVGRFVPLVAHARARDAVCDVHAVLRREAHRVADPHGRRWVEPGECVGGAGVPLLAADHHAGEELFRLTRLDEEHAPRTRLSEHLTQRALAYAPPREGVRAQRERVRLQRARGGGAGPSPSRADRHCPRRRGERLPPRSDDDSGRL
eukprot:CAMPEP_0119181410 /NCGR_PEP_ID=MMETSP1315-20130426/59350_1 /TAXON_ID=676789 /ORGANISM="Prasinoderma singularis, Strain RCC927" /LENGTH=250 /DNA_ID=CAMNT_0007175725 /DNA_START=54 /DNA_END=804 /DNA_ORIENTATION=+